MLDYLKLNEQNDWVNSRFWVNLITKKINDYYLNNIGFNNININGNWGIGKTTIALNVVNNLDKDIKWKSFSLWEYEIDSNPYLKILIGLMNFLNIEINEEIIKKLKFTLSMNLTLFGIFGFGISGEKSKQKSTNNITLIDEIKKNNDIDALIDLINEETKKEKYVIILDEIDRCAPNKVSEFLSIIKNLFFKLKNVYFIVCSNNDMINSIFRNEFSKNIEVENYTDKIFEQSIDLNSMLTFNNLPEMLKNNILIISFIKKMKFTNLRLINKIYNFINNWQLNTLKNYISVWNREEINKKVEQGIIDEAVVLSNDVNLDVGYFYLFFFYFIKFYKPLNFKSLIEKITLYSSLKGKSVSEANDLEKINFVFPEHEKNEFNNSSFVIKNFDIRGIVKIKPSNFLVKFGDYNSEKQISGPIFDFLTQERNSNINFSFKPYEEDYFISNFNRSDFQQLIDEQVINNENKVFLEIWKDSTFKYTFWNIDFENWKKIIFENILLDA